MRGSATKVNAPRLTCAQNRAEDERSSAGVSGLLRRWSRLKSAAKAAGTEPGGAPAVEPVAREAEAADWPSLASLGRDSDYTLLLRAGVPPALKLAGLRRAWTSDPAIAEFRGFGEYDWDLNAPGYGAWTGAAEEALRLAEAVLGPAPPPAVPGEGPGEGIDAGQAGGPGEEDAAERGGGTV